MITKVMILDKSLKKRIQGKKKRLDEFRPLSPSLVNRLRENTLVRWTYNSNAIEGNTLTLRETRLVIEEGLTVKGKPLREHLEATNHKEAILYLEDLVREKDFRLGESLIKEIHSIILKGIDPENAGKYREVRVRITGAKFMPPPPAKIPGLMGDFDRWLKDEENRKNVVDFAALAHFKLVDIHPFVDGNGRTARLLMNLILMNEGYPPAIILKSDRDKYYRTLDQAHRGELKPFVGFVGRAVEQALIWYLEGVIPEKEKKENP